MHSLSTSKSHLRRQPKSLSAAVAAAALLILSPVPSAHAALLRGGDSAAPQSPQQQHELLSNEQGHQDRNRKLVPIEEEEPSTQEKRTLENNDDGVVTIAPFKTTLLAKTFPYHMKFNRDNQISSAVTSYLVAYLEENTNEKVANLGLNCERSEEHSEYVLECTGMATFTEGQPEPNAFNTMLHHAFEGTQKIAFLREMYPNYEMIHEKKEFDLGRRAGSGGNQRKKNGGENNKKKKKGGKKKNNGKKNKKPKQQQMMKPQSSSSGGGNNGDNVFGYNSSAMKQQSQQSDEKNGYTIKGGIIHVDIND